MKKIVSVAIAAPVLVFFLVFRLIFQRTPAPVKNEIAVCGPVRSGDQPESLVFPFVAEADTLEEIAINDNRKSAGALRGSVLFLELETRTGAWYPESREGQGLPVYAFAEVGKSLQLPGPMIRVPEGTLIHARIRHTIPGPDLVLHGFYTRPGNSKDSIIIPFGESRTVEFKTGLPGTYFYWASVGHLNDPFIGLPFFKDSQLFGAFIVDGGHTKPDPEERIILISIWNDTLQGSIEYEREALAMNGLTWPFTERLIYEAGKPVHFRVINASNQEHPMHLHGFYFTVNSIGHADRDSIYNERDQYLAVTELLKPHGTLSFTWIPDREGNWLFHCHTLYHIMPGSFLRKIPEMSEARMNDVTTHAREGMGGLIMGITVQPVAEKKRTTPENTKTLERQLTLIVQDVKNYCDTLTGKGFILQEGSSSSGLNASIPGPPIIIERDKPVAIKIINRLKESTTIHWHGLEIDSYYDGVAGWGNRGNELAPIILPGDSFTVHMTPPRAGTFIYHTHMHSFQLFQGMYGAFIVTDSSHTYDISTDKIFLISQGVDAQLLTFISGKTKPDPMTLKQGFNYRLRIINITPVSPDFTVSLLRNSRPVNWRILAKDGAELIDQQQILHPAINQPISIGQTADFEFNANRTGKYNFVVKNYLDSVVVQQTLVVQ